MRAAEDQGPSTAQYFTKQGFALSECSNSPNANSVLHYVLTFLHTHAECRWKEGYCHFGDRCNFAHGEHELRYVPPEVVSQFEQHKRIQDQAGLGPGGPMLPVGPAPRPPPPAGPMPPSRPQQSMTPPRQQGRPGPIALLSGSYTQMAFSHGVYLVCLVIHLPIHLPI